MKNWTITQEQWMLPGSQNEKSENNTGTVDVTRIKQAYRDSKL